MLSSGQRTLFMIAVVVFHVSLDDKTAAAMDEVSTHNGMFTTFADN